MEKDSKLAFKIEDTGYGIAPESISTVFEAFMQGQNGQNWIEGVGLGLPISQKYVNLMGGDISVESELGVGSLFQFSITFKKVSSADLPSQSGHVVAIAPNQPVYRILVNEARPEKSILLVKILEALGIEVRTTASVQVGIEINANWKPHLIFMDINEDTVAKQIKNQSGSVIIIAMVRDTFTQEAIMNLGIEFDDFVLQPIQDDNIFDKLTQHLDLQFIYETPAVETSSSLTNGQIHEKLMALPTSLVSELNHAAIGIDRKAIANIIEQIREQNEPLASALGELAKKFRFDKLVTFTEKVEGNDDSR